MQMDAGYQTPGREYGLKQMSKVTLVLSLILLTSCAKIRPVVNYTCMGCSALVSSGICNKFSLSERGVKVDLPSCKEDEIIVIDNWEEVTRKNALPKLSCERK